MEDFLGNHGTRERLQMLAEAGRLHSCMLFEGPQGLGKSTTATWVAMLANCADEDEAVRPCGQCWSCRQIPKGQHPDIIRIGLDPAKTAPIISVSQARSLISQLMVKPFHAKHRFVIIDPADAMTPEAANALLKTFEDPPSHTHFILVTSAPVSLLLTVRSRSQRVRFAPVAQSDLANWLKEKGVDDADEVARLAEGRPGHALEMNLDGVDDWRTARDGLLDALSLDAAGRFRYAEKLCKGDRSKWLARVEQALDAVSALLRDALAHHGNSSVVYNDDRLEVVEDWSQRLGANGIGQMSIAVSEARERLQRFVNGRLVLDALLGRLVHALTQGGKRASV